MGLEYRTKLHGRGEERDNYRLCGDKGKHRLLGKEIKVDIKQ